MSLRLESTLAGYARAAVTAKHAMFDTANNPACRKYVDIFFRGRTTGPDDPAHDKTVDALQRSITAAWQHGEPYVLAPAMTAVVAAAASALDLTGEIVGTDEAPEQFGCLFLPEPIRIRRADGRLNTLAALTWTSWGSATLTSWLLCGWAERHTDDPHDIAFERELADHPDLARQFGPYLLVALDDLPADETITARGPLEPGDEAVHRWETAPDGAVVIDDTGHATGALMSILYAFWRIQAQPLAVTSLAPIDRGTRRRAERAAIKHTTRVVMLRRTKTSGDHDPAQARRQYQVRWIVRGHWRRLTNTEGRTYRIWINAHIKGPDDAPLLGGEKVNILAR